MDISAEAGEQRQSVTNAVENQLARYVALRAQMRYGDDQRKG